MEFVVVKSKKQMKTERKTTTHQHQGKFCNVCYQAGKTHEEYTSHYLRESPDPASKIVCPTLLAIECKYCHECGHTPKYCPKLQEKKARESERTSVVSSSPITIDEPCEPETMSVYSSASSVRVESRLSTSDEPTKLPPTFLSHFDIRMLEEDDIWDRCVNYDYNEDEVIYPVAVCA